MSYPGAYNNLSNALEWCRNIAGVVNGIMQGRTNNYGTVTLTDNATSTTVTLARGRISINSVILFMPLTASASADYPDVYVAEADIDVAAGTFDITHPNTADTDKNFRFVIIG